MNEDKLREGLWLNKYSNSFVLKMLMHLVYITFPKLIRQGKLFHIFVSFWESGDSSNLFVLILPNFLIRTEILYTYKVYT